MLFLSSTVLSTTDLLSATTIQTTASINDFSSVVLSAKDPQSITVSSSDVSALDSNIMVPIAAILNNTFPTPIE